MSYNIIMQLTVINFFCRKSITVFKQYDDSFNLTLTKL